MTAEELAEDLEAKSRTCRKGQKAWGQNTPNFSRIGGKAVAYEHCASIIRQDLCTPNPLHDAAPDLLAALEALADLDRTPDRFAPSGILQARRVIARAKGIQNV